MKGRIMDSLIKDDGMTKDFSSFKDGVFDSVVHGQKNDDKNCSYYKQGYDYGLGWCKNSISKVRFLEEKNNVIWCIWKI